MKCGHFQESQDIQESQGHNTEAYSQPCEGGDEEKDGKDLTKWATYGFNM